MADTGAEAVAKAGVGNDAGGGAPTGARPVIAHPRLCVALLVALGFALGCAEFIVIGIEPDIADSFGVSLSRAGDLVSYFALSYAVMTPVLALATGRFRRFPLLVAYASVFLLANVAMMLAPTFELLLAARVLTGAVSGPLLAVGVTYVPELVSDKRASVALSLIYGAFSVAMVISTSVGKIVADQLSWHYAMIGTFVLVAVVCVALVAVLPRSGSTDMPATLGQQLRLLGDARVLSGIAIFVFGVGSVYVFYAYITPYLENVLGMSALAASGMLMAYGVVCFFSNLLSGWVDLRFGVPALVVVFLVQAGLLGALFTVGAAMPWALVVILLIALSMYVASVSCVSLFMKVARTEYPTALTLATSLEPMAFNIGIAFGTAVGGAVVGGIGMRYVGLVGACFSLVACGVVLLTLHFIHKARARREAQRDTQGAEA